MEKLYKLLPHDKLLHYFFGSVIAVGVFALTKDVVVSGGVVAAVAVGKEVYDKVSGKGTPDVLDVVYTVLGGVVPLAVALV